MFSRVLVANRGEIAIRIMRAAAELGIATVAVYSSDDSRALHVRRADECVPLAGNGVAAYLDADQLCQLALATGCDAVHPGYGFLSETAAFARQCAENHLAFVGPSLEILDTLGDKTRARALAERLAIPTLLGTSGPTSLPEAEAFYASLPPASAVMVKAVAGGGGRGMRLVNEPAELEEAFARCASEAWAAFGNRDLFVEQALTRARHIEIQILGDGESIGDLGERECSIQRQRQKLIEIAPSPSLDAGQREALREAARRMAGHLGYRGIGTFEFLVDARPDAPQPFIFIEANPRLQVEHTVTEQVTGIDLVKAQFHLAAGATLGSLGLGVERPQAAQGFAIQLRINAESITPDGTALPSSGVLKAFDIPSGPGIRVDTAGYTDYRIDTNFDSLLAKLVIHSTSANFKDAAVSAWRALREFRIEGVATNIALLDAILNHSEFLAGHLHTRFVEEHAALLAGTSEAGVFQRFFASREAGTDTNPKLSGKRARPPNTVPVPAPLRGLIVSVDVEAGAEVLCGQQVAVIESMKMEFVVTSEVSGIVRAINVSKGEVVDATDDIAYVEPAEVSVGMTIVETAVDPDYLSPQLQEVNARHELTRDDARPAAVARRRKNGMRTARENVADLCDPGSFKEYGALVLAAQRSRRSLDELIGMSPADGIVSGIGTVNGDLFGPATARCMVLAYDYMTFAGTQGLMSHRKIDRMFDLAAQGQLPLILFAEGGGGRPGEFDQGGVAAFENKTFLRFGRLSGLIPLVGIAAGRCFAGNAALLGCCDVVIATQDSSIGMAGPAMIEGGGLGVVRPEEVGPIDVQAANGVVDIIADDEADAVRIAKQYLSYFQGFLPDWKAADQRALRAMIPENRLRAYDVRAIIEALADTGSVLELRPKFGLGMITAFIRVEGKPLGLIANNSVHLGGAIDASAADKASRFMQCCDAFDIPILSLCDTPGFMVGPEAETTGLVRHVSRMYVVGANVDVPFFTVVLRKAYGLGAIAMAGGSFHNPFFTVSWPTGEFGPMGLEGSVRLAYRRELEAIEDEEARKVEFQRMVAGLYEHGKAINAASYFELDDVIDPAETRGWISHGLNRACPADKRKSKKRNNIDSW